MTYAPSASNGAWSLLRGFRDRQRVLAIEGQPIVHPPCQTLSVSGQTTTPGTTSPTLFDQCVTSFAPYPTFTWEGKRANASRLTSLPNDELNWIEPHVEYTASMIAPTILTPCLLLWSTWGLNPRPLAQQSGVSPIETTGRPLHHEWKCDVIL